MVVLSTKLQGHRDCEHLLKRRESWSRCRVHTSVPLRLFVKHPQLQVELQLGSFPLPFLHGGQPVSTTVKGSADHLKLMQAQLVDELLLHDVQLWERRQRAELSWRPTEADSHLAHSPQPYVVQQFVSLEGVELQVTRIPVQHQGFGTRVHHQVCLDTFSCTSKQSVIKRNHHIPQHCVFVNLSLF